MRFEVHALSGAAVAGLVCRVLPTNEVTLLFITAGMVAGSVLPDIDSTQSKVSDAGIITGAVSILADTTLGHRGFLHTPAFVTVLLAIWNSCLHHFADQSGPMLLTYHLGLSLIIGYSLHLLVDMFSSYGIMLLYPFTDKRFHFKHTVKMGSEREAQIFAILVLLCAAIYIIPRGVFSFSNSISTFIYKMLDGCKYYVLSPYGLNL